MGSFLLCREFFERAEAVFIFLPGLDGSGEDVVIPAVDLELLVGEGAGDFRMGLQIF
jgi:hypothetical protein